MTAYGGGHYCENEACVPGQCRAATECASNEICTAALACACGPGFADCNPGAPDGCETNINTSASNCGLCGNVCPSTGANVAGGTCAGGACGLVCNSGFADCNPGAADGCETNINTSTNNCGACGNACPTTGANVSGGKCTSGACCLTCISGFADCNPGAADGCETNIATDPLNCGGCGVSCPSGHLCVAGGCV